MQTKTPIDEKLKIFSPRAELGVKEPCFSAGKDKPNLTNQLTSVLLM